LGAEFDTYEFRGFGAADAELPLCVTHPVAVVQRVLLEQCVNRCAVGRELDRVGVLCELHIVWLLELVDELDPQLAIVRVVSEVVVDLLDLGVLAPKGVDLAHRTHLHA
jgi:hypothetical protein